MSIVVTGAAGALGSIVARGLHASGHPVCLMDRPDALEGLDALRAELGERCERIALDVASAEGWKSALVQTEGALGQIQGAALVAGGWQGGERLHEMEDDAVWDAMLQINLQTAYQSLRALLPRMVRRGAGSVVLVGSQHAERPWAGAGSAAYAVAKSGVVALARVVAEEVRGEGVRVNAVLPSTIDTPANRAAMPGAHHDSWVDPAALCDTIAYLLGPAARDVSGAALPVYGRC